MRVRVALREPTRDRLFALLLTCALVITTLPLAPALEAAAATGDPFRFIYDQAGRLVASVTPTDTAIYSYDAVGNITAITRQAATVLAVIEFAPHAGAVGATVTISGTAFSPTPSLNTVKFNGTAATVISSTTTQIVTTVPAAATTGTISVKVGSTTKTSTGSFTVGATAPTITSYNLTGAASGTPVVVTGTNFDSTLLNDNVRLNANWARVTAATATSLTLVVPPAVSSGPISIATVSGKAIGADFIVPPFSYAVTDVEQTRRIEPGSSGTLSITTAGKIALVLFTATKGQRVALQTAGTFSNTADVSIVAPDGSTVFAGPAYDGNTFTNALTLTQAGTYSLVIDPQGTATNTWTVNVYDVPADFSSAITPGGAAVIVTTTVPGQNAKLTFTGSAAQRLSFTSSGSVTVYVSISAPDGTMVFSGPFYGGGGFTDRLTLTQSGTYTILIDPGGTETGSWTTQLYDVTDDFSAQVTPSPSGAAVVVTTTAPGQNALITFTGAIGQRISVLSPFASWSASVGIKKPDNQTYLYSPSYIYGDIWIDAASLDQTGTYTIEIDPGGTAYGSRTFTVYDVPADFSAAITMGGPAVTAAITTPGQNAALTFSAAAGQRVSVSSPYASWSTTFGVRSPDLTYAYGPFFFNQSNIVTGLVTLGQTGTYTLVIDPASSATGNRDFTLADEGFGALPGAVLALIDPLAAPLSSASDGGPLGPRLASRDSGPGVSPTEEAGDDADQWKPDPANRRRWLANRPDPPARREPALYAPPGVTALSGQILGLSGQPLEGVRVAIGERATTTDAKGRFLLAALAAGHAVMIVNGSPDQPNKKNYGMFEIGVDVSDGRTSVLPYTIWLPRIDDASAVQFPSPTTTETVITTPQIPGLELHLPAGSVVKDMSGAVVTSVSLTAIPIDRPPFPLPKFEEIPIYFTAQPGCAYVFPDGAQIWYPNYTGLAPGTRVNFWSYEPEDDEGWQIYGHGTVTDDGRQVRPDADTSIYEFTGAMFGVPFVPPEWSAAVGDFFTGGDPVDLGSGLFVMDHTDLVLPDVTPVSLTRTYRQNDTNNRGWGPGWSHPYFVYLWPPTGDYQQVDLVLPDEGRVHYVRTSPGVGFADAVFEHTATPSAFYKSHIVWNGNGWDLTLKDGSKLVFLENGPLTFIVDRYGNRTSLLRTVDDPKGNIQVIRSDNGRWLKFTYDTDASLKRITRVEDNTGRAVTYDYTLPTAAGRLWKVHDAFGGITEYGYDAADRLRTIKDARGITYLTVDYDANGRVQTQTQADATTFGFAYTVVNGKVTQTDVTDPRAFVRRVTFNAAGYGLSDTAALGQSIAQTVSYERDAASNQILSVTDPLSRVTRNTYYPSGELWTTTSLYGTPDAVTTTFTYEPVYSQLASVSDPLNHTTTFGYDAAVNRTSETDALQHATTFTYTTSGQLQTATSALQKTTTFAYDAGDLVSIADPLGRITKRFSDSLGRPTAVTDALGNRTRTDYDALNRVTKVTDPIAGATQFTYDANGNRLTVKDAKNNTTTYTYNNLDQLATRKDALLRTETYNSYDPNGNLLVVTDRKSQVTEFRYDALDRQTFAGFGRTGTSPNYVYQSTISYSYDAGNRLHIATDSVSGTITREYDGLGRMWSETTGQGVVTYLFDTASRRTQLQVAGQTAVTYGYDNADRLQTITQGATVVGFGYDNADRRTLLTLPGNLSVDYGYDDASQLLSLTYKRSGSTIGDLAYTYDGSGRRATTSGSYARLNLPAALSSALYNANNQLTKWGTTNISYDLNGNMSGDGVNTYNWNARDQLSSVIKTGQTLPSFIYDAFGRRQKKTLGATVTSYLYDGTNAVQELTNGTPSANMLTGLGVDEVFQRSESAATRTFLSDALGSTLALADTSGVVQTSYTYAPYGETTVTGTTSTNTTQYTGRENDNDGLYFYRARYYHPVFSRFVSEDPIGFGGGDANLYRYVNSNPTNMTDPTGNCPICVVVLVAWMIADAHDLFLSGRKHSKAEYALFAVNLTPIGRIGRAIGLTSEAARAAVQTARGLQKAWTHLEKAGLLTKWSGKTSPAQISSMLRGILENPIAVADDVLYKTPVKVFLGEFRDAPIAVFVSQETGKVVSAFVPSVERFMRLFVK